jgi:hypothetical protein
VGGDQCPADPRAGVKRDVDQLFRFSPGSLPAPRSRRVSLGGVIAPGFSAGSVLRDAQARGIP